MILLFHNVQPRNRRHINLFEHSRLLVGFLAYQQMLLCFLIVTHGRSSLAKFECTNRFAFDAVMHVSTY
jgi:hypothetical protein